jgi:hypothetical protein
MTIYDVLEILGIIFWADVIFFYIRRMFRKIKENW